MKKKILFWLAVVIIILGTIITLYLIDKEKSLIDDKSKVKASDDSQVHLLKYAESPADNPLKGFAGYQGTGSYSDFPSSLEFISIPLSEIVIGENKYNWKNLDNYLNEVASYGRQSIVSFYMDMPGHDICIPQYLRDRGLKIYKYSLVSPTKNQKEIGYSPDYSNQELWKMVYSFVREFGNHYDGDVRIAQIEASIVGIWGEWHTSTFKYGLEDEQLGQLAKVYDQSFNKTQISCRYPKAGTNNYEVGYSDYSFCYESIVDGWSQWNRLKSFTLTDYWTRNMGGGELMPQYVKKIFETQDWCLKKGESYKECLNALHPSWLLVGSLTDFAPIERENAIEAASQLGYDFTVTQARYMKQLDKGTTQMELGISVKNIGIAPFYYNWDSKIILVDEYGKEVYQEKTGWDLTKIQPDKKEYEFSHNISVPQLAEGSYTILYQVINPLKGGYSLRFANQTQLKNGKLVLGEFSIGNPMPKKSIVNNDNEQNLIKQYNLQVTSKYVNDEIKINENYLLGVRIRNLSSQYIKNINGILINVYYDDNLINSISTDWKVTKIKPNNNSFFAWNLRFDRKGIYNLKLRFLPETEEVEIGSVHVQ
ncbi:DUF4832 domain-containing protein [Anaerosacchariphilus polymeriproducens]|uniref:DUF4832 domain-containing protein n=1 Tax=Anaerosacchariphilus polymeriproducens TaxID=1812858 RepID=A0A371AYZ7_9FIRM|nr:DUF4832 domain-containing protein [Anaerosacchariphilus polymeriproducens]RDU24781.1 DUF4832 domain-containing protein [Anaerosacchariphilus polymeriproducens]